MNSNCSNYFVLAERELIFLLKSGDKLAFEQLYNNYKARLYNNILRIVKTEEQTERLLEEVFVKIWSTKEDIDPRTSFRTHVFKIVENLIYDSFRKAALNKKIENHFITVATTTANRVEKQFYYNRGNTKLLKVIDELPYPRKEGIYRLGETDGRIYNQADLSPGISKSGINGHIIRASQTVRKFFRLTTT